MFEPSSVGIAKEKTHVRKYTRKRPRSGRAPCAARVISAPSTQNERERMSCSGWYGKWPLSGNSRISTTSLSIADPITAAGNASSERRDRDRGQREHLDSQQRRQRVVEDAVGDERVAPRVPEVVPEHEAVLEEERALVDVRGDVVPRRAGPEQNGRERRCSHGCKQSFARQGSRAAQDHPRELSDG